MIKKITPTEGEGDSPQKALPPKKTDFKSPIKKMNKTTATKSTKVFQTIVALKKVYPDFFSPRDKKNLTKGVANQLIAAHPELKKVNIRQAMALWCGSLTYQHAMLANETRYNLDGSAAEIISDAEKDYARRRITLLLERKKTIALAQQGPLEKKKS